VISQSSVPVTKTLKLWIYKGSSGPKWLRLTLNISCVLKVSMYVLSAFACDYCVWTTALTESSYYINLFMAGKLSVNNCVHFQEAHWPSYEYKRYFFICRDFDNFRLRTQIRLRSHSSQNNLILVKVQLLIQNWSCLNLFKKMIIKKTEKLGINLSAPLMSIASLDHEVVIV